jgi:hypothetical protein
MASKDLGRISAIASGLHGFLCVYTLSRCLFYQSICAFRISNLEDSIEFTHTH